MITHKSLCLLNIILWCVVAIQVVILQNPSVFAQASSQLFIAYLFYNKWKKEEKL